MTNASKRKGKVDGLLERMRKKKQGEVEAETQINIPPYIPYEEFVKIKQLKFDTLVK